MYTINNKKQFLKILKFGKMKLKIKNNFIFLIVNKIID